jgi:tetratricopeptide (TPR) repeat protein
VLVGQKKLEEAEAEYREALRLRREAPWVVKSLGRALRAQGKPAAVARFYAEAFAAAPKVADDPGTENRYNAACAAALAGCGQHDGAKLDDAERARLRRQALDWLRADLAAWSQRLEKEPGQARAVVKQKLQYWQQDADFAGVRGDALAKLPEAERQAWQQLWADVEALRLLPNDPKARVKLATALATPSSATVLLKELLAEQPEDLQRRELLASTLCGIGVMKTGLKQYDEAERSLQRALELRESLAKQQPDKTGAALDLAEVRAAFGRVYWDTDRRPEADRLWQQVLRELHQVAADKPEEESTQQRVLSCVREICRHGATESLTKLEQKDGWRLLFDGKTLEGWAAARGKEFGGRLRVADGAVVLERDARYTGIVSTRMVPLINYEIAYDVWPEGPGEFASLVFPCGDTYGRWYVGETKTHLGNDLIASATLREMAFPAKQWLALRLRVTSEWIEAWRNGEELFRVKTEYMKENWGPWLYGGSTGFLLFTADPEIRVRNIRIRQVEPGAKERQESKPSPSTTKPSSATTKEDTTRKTP